MEHYFMKLIPPRKNFPVDMSPAEGAVMQKHVEYWLKHHGEKRVVVFGPVMDPAGTFGISVLEALNEADARAVVENDPAITSGLGFTHELHAMPRAIVRS